MTMTDSGAYPRSYYAATATPFSGPGPLAGEHRADVCIIGGGYTGLSCALHLAERGYRVVLLEAERIGWGASGRNGGQLGSGQRRDQIALERLLGEEHARQLWQLAEEAKNRVKTLIARHRIDCDLRPGIAFAAHKPALAGWARDYALRLRERYDYPDIRPLRRDELAELLGTGVGVYHGGWLDRGAAHLHPLNYALGLARAAAAAGAVLYQGSRALGYRDGGRPRVYTAAGAVSADALVLACNGYLGRLAPPLAGTIMPINNFILATEPLLAPQHRRILPGDIAVADSRFVINYFRLSAERRLLFGGGENYTRRFPRELAGFVRRHMLKIYPELAAARIDYAWGGTLAITRNRLPQLGRLEGNTYFAQGYSGHGVGTATLAGQLIAEAVAGSAERFDLFAKIPTPRFPGGRYLRWPGQTLGMLYYALRDRL